MCNSEELYDLARAYAAEEKIEGNLFTFDESNVQRNDGKMLALSALAQGATSIMEVGFNAGHSLDGMLCKNHTIKKATVFDINRHAYTSPCFRRVQELYPDTELTFIPGDSTKTLPSHVSDTKYDLVHIDGGHSHDVAYSDITSACQFMHRDSLMVVDDCHPADVDSCLGGAVRLSMAENKVRLNSTLDEHIRDGQAHVMLRCVF